MVSPAVQTPNQRLIDNRFDDVELHRLSEDEYHLSNSFRRVVTKKRVLIVASTLFSVLLIIGLTLTAVFVSRSNYSKSFKKNLVNHVRSDFASIDPKLLDTYVKELTQLYDSRMITYDHVLEFDTMYNFDQFNKKFNRVHASQQERLDKFMTFRNKYFMVKHKGHETYKREINRFADMSDEQFNKLFPPLKVPQTASTKEQMEGVMTKRLNFPKFYENLQVAKGLKNKIADVRNIDGENLDWRKCNGVTRVKDQGLCGSCWAFASIGSVESLFKIHEGKTLDLSEQELVDCDDKSNGCEGGFGDTALEYIKNKGISSSADVPYHAKDEQCSIKSKNKVFITHLAITKGLDILNKSLVLNPTIVYIAASNEMTMYKSGVYNGECGKELNHAVLLVGEGYDSLLGKRYWVIKNSWGPHWGEEGYIRLERTNKGTDKCGVLDTGITPIL